MYNAGCDSEWQPELLPAGSTVYGTKSGDKVEGSCTAKGSLLGLDVGLLDAGWLWRFHAGEN